MERCIFVDALCAADEFNNSYKNIYPSQLMEHKGAHVTFLGLGITLIDGTFVCKLFDKREKSFFFVLRMPNLESNIPLHPSSICAYFRNMRIASHTLLLQDFILRTASLYHRMINQGSNPNFIFKMYFLELTKERKIRKMKCIVFTFYFQF